jgi:hypothetical protein
VPFELRCFFKRFVSLLQDVSLRFAKLDMTGWVVVVGFWTAARLALASPVMSKALRHLARWFCGAI